MGPRPQQPEIHRSGRTELDPDHFEAVNEVQPQAPEAERERGAKVPPENQPGPPADADADTDERPPDQPDLDAMADRLGTKSPERRRLDRWERRADRVGRLVASPLRVSARVLEGIADLVDRRAAASRSTSPDDQPPSRHRG